MLYWVSIGQKQAYEKDDSEWTWLCKHHLVLKLSFIEAKLFIFGCFYSNRKLYAKHNVIFYYYEKTTIRFSPASHTRFVSEINLESK